MFFHVSTVPVKESSNSDISDIFSAHLFIFKGGYDAGLWNVAFTLSSSECNINFI